LGCENLINTKMLKEHMHGYLMHEKLFNKLKDKLESANITERRKKRVEEMVNKELPKQI
jgi:ribosome biogenesis protein ENP2